MIVSTSKPDCSYFWVATLSSGLEVFEDFRVGQKSAWLRLKDLLKSEGWHVTMLSLVTPTSTVCFFGGDGYFFSNKIEAYASGDFNYQKIFKGIGLLENGQVNITWVDTDTGDVTTEKRDISRDNNAIILSVSDDGKLFS